MKPAKSVGNRQLARVAQRSFILLPLALVALGCGASTGTSNDGELDSSQPAPGVTPAAAEAPPADPILQGYERAKREFSGDHGEPLPQFAAKCDLATGVHVPDFKCSDGTEVPIDHFSGGVYPAGTCDRPNRLNLACDPGSRFQVLANTHDAVVVAHCRKKGLPGNLYGDIAVIQYNAVNGATCFYQALGQMDGDFKAPARGTSLADEADTANPEAAPWLSNFTTQNIDCRGCHDNGAIIRSPYLAQLASGNDALPGAVDFSYNKTNPVSYIGTDYQSWRTWSVQVSGSVCNNCHRMGVSNTASAGSGTARDFGIRATAISEMHKNPHSAASPIWMIPNQIFFNQDVANAAQTVKACADSFHAGGALPAGCSIADLSSPFHGLSPAIVAQL